MDADFSHHPRYLPALIAGMKDHDLMIGSRYIAGGGSVNWPWSRRFMSKGINLLVSMLLRVPGRDTSGGLRCYSVAMLRRTRLDLMASRGYSFQQEILFRCCKAGCRVGEIPIIFEERRAGKTKVNIWEAVRSISMICRLGLRNMVGLNADAASLDDVLLRALDNGKQFALLQPGHRKPSDTPGNQRGKPAIPPR